MERKNSPSSLQKSPSKDFAETLNLAGGAMLEEEEDSEGSEDEEEPPVRYVYGWDANEVEQEATRLRAKAQASRRPAQKPERSRSDENCEEDNYGVPSGLTAERGRKAHAHVADEVLQLCQIIEQDGMRVLSTGETLILFGDLWERYNAISDKVVGMLIRARKYRLLYFEGETLFERRDYGRPILMLMSSVHAEQVLHGGGGGGRESFQFGSFLAA